MEFPKEATNNSIASLATTIPYTFKLPLRSYFSSPCCQYLKKEQVAPFQCRQVFSTPSTNPPKYRTPKMVHSAIILAFFALAVHGAPRENRDHDGAHRVIWVPVPADTTVAAPTNTATSPTRANGCAAEFYSVGREDDKMAAMLVQGARSTKPDQAAVVQFASTTISRPSKVTSVATRTVSSNKLSPTGTSTTTMTTTVTMPGKRPSETPSRGPDNGVETKTRRNVFYVENWSAVRSINIILVL